MDPTAKAVKPAQSASKQRARFTEFSLPQILDFLILGEVKGRFCEGGYKAARPLAANFSEMGVEETLSRIEALERSVRPTLMTRILRLLGQSKLFGSIYKHIGPRLDPWLMKRMPLLMRIYGLPALVLTSTGARSGQPRTVPLLYVRQGESFVVLGSNFGQLHHPAWTANLLAHPEASIQIGPERLAVTASLLDPALYDETYQRFVAIYPGYANYLKWCGDRKPRMFVLQPQ